MKIRILLAALLIALAVFWQYYLKGYLLLPSAERFVASYYDQYNHGEFGYIYNVLSHQKLRNNMTLEHFNDMMADTQIKLGNVQSRKRAHWKVVFQKFGTFAFLEYQVQRAKTRTVEKFVLVRKNKDWFVFDYVIRASVGR